MTMSPGGTLYVGSIGPNAVYALPDRNKDGRPDEVITIARNLNRPNGVAFHDGSLYVSEISRVLRYDDIEKNLAHPPKPVVVTEALPDKEWHGYKFIDFGPDGYLYIPVGAPCNVCERDDVRFASILRMKPGDKKPELFASGVRNTVGFDWHPQTKEMWFTDNGRDYLGDNLPPDELNHAPRAGMHFGFPYRYGSNKPDPEFGAKGGAKEYTPPAQELGPHVAALGMCFYTGSKFPPEYRGNIFIAEHGSWNRSNKIGYRVSMVKLEGDKPVEYKTFCDGWLAKAGDKDSVWGRPVDVLCTPDGALLVSDDKGSSIFKITYTGAGR